MQDKVPLPDYSYTYVAQNLAVEKDRADKHARTYAAAAREEQAKEIAELRAALNEADHANVLMVHQHAVRENELRRHADAAEAALAAAETKALELRKIGAQMANICFNLSQHEDTKLDSRARQSMRDCQQEWDAAIRR